MLSAPTPLPPPPPPQRGREHFLIPAGVAAKETRLIDVKSTIILFYNYFGTLFTGCLIDRGQLCFSQQKKFWCWWKDVYYSILFGGGSGFMNFVLSWVCCCQLIALFWNVIAKSTWHAQGKQSVAIQLKAEYLTIKTSSFVSGHMVFFLATWHKEQWWWAHGTQKLIIINVVMTTTFYWIRKKPGCICMLSLNSSIQVGYYRWLHSTGKLIKFNSYYLHSIIL